MYYEAVEDAREVVNLLAFYTLCHHCKNENNPLL